MTEQLITEFKQALEEVALVPASGGRFEVYVDGEMVFSKKEAGRFPKYEEVRSVVQQRLKR